MAKWSQNVKIKHPAPDNLFLKGSVDDIVNWVKKTHNTLQSAVASLNFFLNRAGTKISPRIRQKVKRARERLRSIYSE